MLKTPRRFDAPQSDSGDVRKTSSSSQPYLFLLSANCNRVIRQHQAQIRGVARRIKRQFHTLCPSRDSTSTNFKGPELHTTAKDIPNPQSNDPPRGMIEHERRRQANAHTASSRLPDKRQPMAIFKSVGAEFWVDHLVPLEVHVYVPGLVGGEFGDG